MQLYIYPGRTPQICQFCQSQTIPRTFFQGQPVCLKCTELKGFNPILFSDKIKRRKNVHSELPLSEQEEARIISLLIIPQKTSEVASHIGISRGTALKKLTYLEVRRKVIRFTNGVGKPSWWTLNPDAVLNKDYG